MRVVLGILLCLVGLIRAQDPCTTPTLLTQKERNTKYVLDRSKGDPLCDDLMTPGWYRFKGKAGVRMAEGKMDTGRCGTSAPLYIDGAHPKDYIIHAGVKVCANFGLTGKGCEWSNTISIKKCKDPAGDYFVYQLKPTPSCSMAYCGYGDEPVVCPAGKALDQTKKKCIEATPSIIAPAMGTPVVTGDDFHIPCNLNVKLPADRANGAVNVSFMFNGKMLHVIEDVPLTDMQAKLPGVELKGKLPSKVSCGVVGFWKHHAGSTNYRTKMFLSSNSFFAGIKVTDDTGAEVKGEIIFGEDDARPRKLYVVSTIPITKSTHNTFLEKEPTLEFGLSTQVDKGVLKINEGPAKHSCSVKILSSSWSVTNGEASAKAELQFVAYQDMATNSGSMTRPNDLQLALGKTLTSFSIWTGLKVAPIKGQQTAQIQIDLGLQRG